MTPALAPHPLASPDHSALYRATTDPNYFGWLDHVSSAAGCSQPIRLAGRIATLDNDGQVLTVLDTERMPDGVIYKNCGNRRASVCTSCSTTYRRDAYQLIRAGLVGGKGVPATVASNPAVFATFTPPASDPSTPDALPEPERPARAGHAARKTDAHTA